MDLEYVGHVLARLRPLIRDGQLRRSRLERVLTAGAVPSDSVRADVERMLSKVDVIIVEDASEERPGTASIEETERRAAPTGSHAADSAVTQADLAPDELPELPRSTELLEASRGDHREAAVAAGRQLLAADATVHARQRHKRLLTAELEVGLALLMRGGSGAAPGDVVYGDLAGEARAAAEAIFLHNQRLVHKIAQRYPSTGMEYEDVVQFGFVGLVRAVEKFDPTAGFKFSTYATWWIRQAITRGIADHARLIRFPVHMVERLQKVWRTRDRLTLDGEPPSIHALALATGYTDDQVREAIKLGHFEPLSLDMPVGSEGEATLADLLDLSDERLNAVHEVEFMLLQEQLHAVLDTLSEREAGVVAMRFGLADGERKTLDEIGKVYGVTRERIRQIESKTISKLRHRSRSHVLEGYFYDGGRRPKTKESGEQQEQHGEQSGPAPSDQRPTNSQGDHGGRGEPSPESGWFRRYAYGAGHPIRAEGWLELAPRTSVIFLCPREHRFDRTFFIDAELPETWTCPRCGREGTVAPTGLAASGAGRAAQPKPNEVVVSGLSPALDEEKILRDLPDEHFGNDVVTGLSKGSGNAWPRPA